MVIDDDVMLSLLFFPDSPEPLLELALEFLGLFPDSPLPRRIVSDLERFPFSIVDSLREPHSLAISDRKSEMAVVDESLLLVETLFIPESAELSRLFFTDEDSVVVPLPHGKLLAKSANVSLRHN